MANGGRWQFMNVCPAALISDRLYFSDRQYSAYTLWIYHAWQRDGNLPADPVTLSKIALSTPSIAKQTLEVVLARGLGALNDGRLRLWHVDNDLERAARISQKRGEAGRRSAEVRFAGGAARDE
jgi:uncharacterized protein YdaU (DUF1376 family)